MKIGIKYSRGGAASYISHLDMQRTFARALRRANLPVLYSQGFNPHIVMSFASPLSVGYFTMADYLEVGVADGTDTRQAMEALNAVLTRDIRVERVFALPEGTKKLMALNHSAAYDITFMFENESECDKISCATERLNGSEKYLTPDRKGREVDIRPQILELSAAGRVVSAVVKNSSEGALNPAVLANALLSEAGISAEYGICRTECFAALAGGVAPFYALGG